MFEDDVYDFPYSDGRYMLLPVAGGWQVIDSENSERFGTVFTSRQDAVDICSALNEGQSYIDAANERTGTKNG